MRNVLIRKLDAFSLFRLCLLDSFFQMLFHFGFYFLFNEVDFVVRQVQTIAHFHGYFVRIILFEVVDEVYDVLLGPMSQFDDEFHRLLLLLLLHLRLWLATMWWLRQSVFRDLRCRLNARILVNLLQENRGLPFTLDLGLILHHVGLDFESLALGQLT